MWLSELCLAYSRNIKISNFQIYVKNNTPGTMFKLTRNNIELSLYFSIRYFFIKLIYFRPAPYSAWYYRHPNACNGLIDDIAIIRENLYNDRYIFVKRNKFKFFYLFLLFIMVIEYYIPTLIIRNEMIEIMKEAVDSVENNNSIINMVKIPNGLSTRVLLDSMFENPANKLWIEEIQKMIKNGK